MPRLNLRLPSILLLSSLLSPAICAGGETAIQLRGEIRDARTGEFLPARLYIARGEEWFFARSAADEGTAVEYRKHRQGTQSYEMHTTLSPHPFIAELPPGEYTITVERGKEYLPETQVVRLEDQPVNVAIGLRRWTDMAARGWYSGDTHVHRSLAELPNAMLADDLNVALPLTHWVTQGYQTPVSSEKNSEEKIPEALIRVDETHVIHPLNTEWEIFTVDGKRHTLGAVFALGQQQPIDLGVPPVARVAEAAHRQGALLDLDKHNWPWSMMIVPVMQVDLFELTNNHIWRAPFAFTQFNDHYAPDYMRLETNERGFTEWGWIDFGFQTYYTLLNCGFRLRPSGGTASGVHPVPLGFGRVYAQVPGEFSFERWMKALDAGRSFVTTGPMLFIKANGREAGHTFAIQSGERAACHLTGAAESGQPLDRIDVIANGRVVKTIVPDNTKTKRNGHISKIDVKLEPAGSFWVALRCIERRTDGRIRFAHTSPFHFDVVGQPLRPRPEETAYLIERIEDELARHRGMLSDAAVEEYEKALAVYRELDALARE